VAAVVVLGDGDAGESMTDDVAGDLLIWAVFGTPATVTAIAGASRPLPPTSPQNAHEHPTAPVWFSTDDDQPYQSECQAAASSGLHG
jgi:hypothetical protein